MRGYTCLPAFCARLFLSSLDYLIDTKQSTFFQLRVLFDKARAPNERNASFAIYLSAIYLLNLLLLLSFFWFQNVSDNLRALRKLIE